MQQCGIYEQLITQLLTSRLDRERFYVGERQLEPAEAAVWLSRFLSRVLELNGEVGPYFELICQVHPQSKIKVSISITSGISADAIHLQLII